MTYREYRMKYGEIEHVLIRMTDSFPYFKEKVIMKNGIARVENNYHIADGLFSTYINFEMPDGGISAEISGCPRFETPRDYLYPVFITNVGDKSFDIHLNGENEWGSISPDEVLAICPSEYSKETFKKFDEESIQRYSRSEGNIGFISQEEINRLLSGK